MAFLALKSPLAEMWTLKNAAREASEGREERAAGNQGPRDPCSAAGSLGKWFPAVR